MFHRTALLIGFLAVALPAAAQQNAPRVIVMTGQGSVAVMPDEATVTAGVVTQSGAAADAVSANAATMERVMAALKRLGIAEGDIHTTRFDLEPQYAAQDSSGQPRRIAGYEATNGVSVRIDDVGHAGAVLDALIQAGANQGVNVEFDVKDPAPALAEARKKAAEDTLARARTYAGTLGNTLGPILSVSEGGNTGMLAGARFKPQGLYSPSPVTVVAAGEQTIDATVTIEWALK